MSSHRLNSILIAQLSMTTFQTISPVDGSIYVERSLATDPQIDQALDGARIAQASWRSSSLSERKALCEGVLRYMLDHADAIGEELAWQMGRPIRYGAFEITKGFQERARYMIDVAESALQDVKVGDLPGIDRLIRREALGTVLVLAPWNYPFLTAVNVIIPAIMAGNAVILKHAQQTPLAAERFGAAFEHAGAMPGLFQYLHLSHEQVARVVGDERIAHVAFTGSVEGGQAVQRALSHRFIIAGLELGGKDPAYVREDADMAHAVENLVDGSFFNSGQSCCGIERIYVHESRFDAFVEEFVALTKQYVLGNPLDRATTLGPMVRSSAAAFVQAQVAEALSKGAQALIGPNDFPAHLSGTPYLAPQVLVKVNHHMQIMTEETFGPVVGIMSVKNDREALQLMNESRYGLTASIWSRDVEAAFRLGDQIETGTVFLNRCDYLDPALAWTGVKDSGRGCTLSSGGYEALTRPKSYHFRH